MRFSGYVVVLLALTAPLARAQAPASDTGSARWAKALTLGVPGANGEFEARLFTAGASFTQVGRGIGPDLSVVTIPYALAYGIVPVAGRLGVAGSIPIERHTYLVPSAGVVGAAAIGASGAGGIAGTYVSLALLTAGESGPGLRIAYSINAFSGDAVSQLEFGFVWGIGR